MLFFAAQGLFTTNCGPCVSEPIPMRKPPTGEPCAGEPHARFGGRGRRKPFPQVVEIPAYRSLDAGVRGHDGTSLRLKARVFNQARRRH